jgi:hypothetical protein
MILENYLNYINEGVFFTKNLHCSILKYSEFGFEKILYIGPDDSTKFSRMFVSGSNTFAFPFTKQNFEDFLNKKEILIPRFGVSFGKFSSHKLAKKLKYLKVLDSGFVDYKTSLIKYPEFLNFRDMKNFRSNHRIIIGFPDEEQPIYNLKLKGTKYK